MPPIAHVLLGVICFLLVVILILLDQGAFPDPLDVGDYEKGWVLDLIIAMLNFALAFTLAIWFPAIHFLRWQVPPKWDIRSKFMSSYKWPFVMSFPLCLAVIVGGGFVNRIRGGWLEVSPGDDLPIRTISCAFLGLVAAVSTGRPVLLPAVWFTAYFGVVEGWGCYFSMGRSNCAGTSRHGMFDWLIGQPGSVEEWDFTRRWIFSYCGMVLRGLCWTGPPGILLNVALRQPRHEGSDIPGQSSWLYALCGSCMGLVYALGFTIKSDTKGFERGTAVSEYMWGFWLTWCMIACAVGMPEAVERGDNSQAQSLLAFTDEEAAESKDCQMQCGACGRCACSLPACAPYYKPVYALRPCTAWALIRAFLTAICLAVMICSGLLLIEVVLENRVLNAMPWID